MANERALVSMAEQFSGLPMRDLIGGPLMAAADANSAMAVSQTKFILDTCFQKDGEKLVPIMITMRIRRGMLVVKRDENDPTKYIEEVEEFETEFQLPLLTVLPLNSLAVDNVDIAFHMEVKSSYGEETSKSEETKFAASSEFSAKLGYGIFSAEIKGSVSYDSTTKSAESQHYEKSNAATYDVKVHAGQLPLPTGITTIIQAYAKAIDPLPAPQP